MAVIFRDYDPPPATVGSVVRFDVIRDESTATLDVPLVDFPVERFGGAPLSLVVFGAGVLVLALVLMLRRTRSTALRLLFVGAAANIADRFTEARAANSAPLEKPVM